MIKLLALKFLLSIFLLSSCALLDDEDENILPGKRESVYESEEKVILKARKRIKLEPEKAIFIYVNNILPPTSSLISSIYEEHKAKDEFLWISYSGENTFG